MAEQANPVNWFEIPAHNLERAKAFYGSVFDVKLTDTVMGPLNMAWFPMLQGAMGATGSLVKGEGYMPSHAGTLVYLTVEDIEGTLSRVAANGGRTLMPKMGIGEYGFIAHFEDSEGNRVALHAYK